MLPRESVKALSGFVRAAAQADRADVAIERALPGDAGRAHYLIAADIVGGPLAGRRTLVLRGQSDDRETTERRGIRDPPGRLRRGIDDARAAVARAERRCPRQALHDSALCGRHGGRRRCCRKSCRWRRAIASPIAWARSWRACMPSAWSRRRRGSRFCRGRMRTGCSSAPPPGAPRWMASRRRSRVSNGRSIGSPIMRRGSSASRCAIATCASAISRRKASG